MLRNDFNWSETNVTLNPTLVYFYTCIEARSQTEEIAHVWVERSNIKSVVIYCRT